MMPEIEIYSLNDKSLLILRVFHWKGPFYLKADGPVKGVYVRLGSTNREPALKYWLNCNVRCKIGLLTSCLALIYR